MANKTITAAPKSALSDELKTFTISKLPEVDRLDEEDLFLMTDREGDKVYTRKLKMSHLLNYLGDNPDLVRQILEQELVDRKILTTIEEAFKVTEIYGGNSHDFNVGA